MKIVSWNCRNGLTEEKANIILKEYPDTDIFVIQECREQDINAFKIDWKYKHWLGDDKEKFSDLGIAVFSKGYDLEFIDTLNREFRYVVPYKLTVNNKLIVLVAVWTKPIPYYYDENVTKAISYYKDLFLEDAIIIGDFNTGYSEKHKKRYSDLCENLNGFKNCALGKTEEFKETFFSYRMNSLYLNDFCFVSESLYANTKVIKIHDDWGKNQYGQKCWNGSDHCPIMVEFDF